VQNLLFILNRIDRTSRVHLNVRKRSNRHTKTNRYGGSKNIIDSTDQIYILDRISFWSLIAFCQVFAVALIKSWDNWIINYLDHKSKEWWLRSLEVVNSPTIWNDAVGSNHCQEILNDSFDSLNFTINVNKWAILEFRLTQ